MNITYTNTLDDLLAFARHHYGSSEGIQRNVRLQRYGGVAVLTGYFFGLGCFDGSVFLFFVGAVTSVAWWVWIPRVLMASYEKQVARSQEGHKNRVTLGTHALEVTEEHLLETNEYGESKVRWPAVEKVVADGDCAFIYLSSAQAHIIPKNRVSSGDFEGFLNATRGAIRAANA